MSSEMIIRNARIVMPGEVVHGVACIRDGRIAALAQGDSAIAAARDWEGDWLLPGLVELHTDNLEKHLMPRPGAHWPALPAVLAHDAQLAAAGITTVFDALALGEIKPDGMRARQLHVMLEAIAVARDNGLTRAQHLLHLRCEVSTDGLLPQFESLARDPALRLVSLMDHTPGQRQFTSLEKYREYYQNEYALSDAEMQAFAERHIANQELHSAANRRAVVAHCRERGIALASHDDATPEHVAQAVSEGVSIAEFPTTAAAARAAHGHGLAVLMGAPNVVRGGSHSGNISVLELARERLLDGLSSDYVPASLLHAAFLLRDRAGWSLPEAIACVSARPARLAGLADRGELAPGLRADLLRVRESAGVPVVLAAWREGRRVV
jgi:alpha-D-ribose 1-methylphosphonate 5-triphosphate diphosphatase